MQHIKKKWADCRELRYILKETEEIKYAVSMIDVVHQDDVDVDENLMHIIHIRRGKKEDCSSADSISTMCVIVVSLLAIFSSAIEERNEC